MNKTLKETRLRDLSEALLGKHRLNRGCFRTHQARTRILKDGREKNKTRERSARVGM